MFSSDRSGTIKKAFCMISIWFFMSKRLSFGCLIDCCCCSFFLVVGPFNRSKIDDCCSFVLVRFNEIRLGCLVKSLHYYYNQLKKAHLQMLIFAHCLCCVIIVLWTCIMCVYVCLCVLIFDSMLLVISCLLIM